MHKQGQPRKEENLGQPPSQLDAPPCPDGYKQRWLRHRVNGADDTKNINARLREGWELVRADETIKEPTLHTTEVSKLMRVSSVWVTCYWQECQWKPLTSVMLTTRRRLINRLKLGKTIR